MKRNIIDWGERIGAETCAGGQSASITYTIDEDDGQNLKGFMFKAIGTAWNDLFALRYWLLMMSLLPHPQANGGLVMTCNS